MYQLPYAYSKCAKLVNLFIRRHLFRKAANPGKSTHSGHATFRLYRFVLTGFCRIYLKSAADLLNDKLNRSHITDLQSHTFT
jgi:hypothetical protein